MTDFGCKILDFLFLCNAVRLGVTHLGVHWAHLKQTYNSYTSWFTTDFGLQSGRRPNGRFIMRIERRQYRGEFERELSDQFFGAKK